MSRIVATLGVASLTGCVWIGEFGELEVDDRDDDGFPVTVDCNDDDPEVDVLRPFTGELTCGSFETRTLDVAGGGVDELDVVNCIDPVDPRLLLQLGTFEHVYRFASDEAAQVSIVIDAGQIELSPLRDAASEALTALAAFRGAQCSLETCTVGLPLTSSVVAADRPDWTPFLEFRTDPEEAWFIVISGGGVDGTSSQYSIDVRCD